MSMRQEFEAFRDKRNALLASEGHTEKSRYWITNAHYPTWEASRAALVVELPESEKMVTFDDQSFDIFYPDDVIKALEAVGIPVKKS